VPCAAGVLIAGDDFKSGQTKIKSVLVDFLVGAGIKPTAIVSYNHLGNNDGMNLSAPQTFRSKEISKSNVVCAPPGAAHARARGGGRGGGLEFQMFTGAEGRSSACLLWLAGCSLQER